MNTCVLVGVSSSAMSLSRGTQTSPGGVFFVSDVLVSGVFEQRAQSFSSTQEYLQPLFANSHMMC